MDITGRKLFVKAMMEEGVDTIWLSGRNGHRPF